MRWNTASASSSISTTSRFRVISCSVRDQEAAVSACVICRSGHLQEGATTLTVERGALTLVLKGVPARVCDACGEGYLDESTTQRVERVVDQLQSTGAQLVMQQFVAA